MPGILRDISWLIMLLGSGASSVGFERRKSVRLYGLLDLLEMTTFSGTSDGLMGSPIEEKPLVSVLVRSAILNC
jgi:hypothetical protein